jgi:NIPSNAP
MNTKTYSPIVELRQYTLHPGKRDALIEIFDREFIETQEAVGIEVIGQFRNLDETDQFVWLRGFNDMSARQHSLDAFYSGPIWKAHRDAANATMIDSDNVLLLRRVHPGSGFTLNGDRRPFASRIKQPGLITGTIYYFDAPLDSNFISYFEDTIKPTLMDAGASILAYFVTEDSPNTFPRLPVREGEHVFVWFAAFHDEEAHQLHTATLAESKAWRDEISKSLNRKLKRHPEVLRLSPTARSRLTGMR